MTKFKFTRAEKINLVLAFIILLILFISSSMPYSEQKMDPSQINHRFGLIEKIIYHFNLYYAGTWHNRISDGSLAEFTQFFVRKLAHFGTYLLLGIFSYSGLKRVFRLQWTAPFFVWFSCLAMAAFDEFHQFLTGDRTPSVHDVMLDGLGAICGIILSMLFIFCYRKFKKNRD